MIERGLKEIVTPTAASDGAGVRLKRSIATQALDHLDPFFLFDHFGSEDANDYIAGFPMHPHRGIETVTYMLDGSVAHRDSLGNAGVIHAGDVQWMTAGSGILHEEMPKVGPRRLDGFQIWVNLPRALKMTAPRYQDVPAASIPEVHRPDGGLVRVVAGQVEGVTGAVHEIFAGPTYLDVSLPGRRPLRPAHPARPHRPALRLPRRGPGGRRRGPHRPLPRLAILGDGDLVRVVAEAPSPLPPALGPAAGGAVRPLRPLRHEHARGDRPGARRAARRDLHQGAERPAPGALSERAAPPGPAARGPGRLRARAGAGIVASSGPCPPPPRPRRRS